MEDFIHQYYVPRIGTDSIKWDGMTNTYGEEGLLPLWVADLDFKVPKEVQHALSERVDHGIFGYSMPPKNYYETYLDWQLNQHDMKIKQDWIRFSTGVVNSIHYMIQCFTKKHDSIMILAPVYYPFFDAVRDNQRKLVVSDLVIEHEQYEMDFDDIEAKIKAHQIKMLIHCSPHNPVGRVWSQTELEKLLDICSKYDCLVVSDEIHQDFVASDYTFVSVLNIGEKYRENLIILNSASKSFNLASLLHSHIVIPSKEKQEQYDLFAKTVVNNAPSLFGMVATQASYEYGLKWLASLNQVIDNNFILLKELFKELLPKAVVYDKQGTYLAWIDLSFYLNGEVSIQDIQHKAKVAVDYGEWFSDKSKTCIRLNLGTHPDIIKQAVYQIKSIF